MRFTVGLMIETGCIINQKARRNIMICPRCKMYFDHPNNVCTECRHELPEELEKP